MPLGGIITIAVLLPNLLFVFFPPRNVPPPPAGKTALTRRMEILERVGQVCAFTIPFFYPIIIGPPQHVMGLVIMFAALGFYYAGWVRYMLGGRQYALLFRPMLGVPLPMAICPVVYFLAAAWVLQSLPLLAATIVLAIGHIYVSNLEYRRLDDRSA